MEKISEINLKEVKNVLKKKTKSSREIDEGAKTRGIKQKIERQIRRSRKSEYDA